MAEAGRLETQEEPTFQFKSEGCLLQNVLLLGGDQSFVLFMPSSDWMRPTYTKKNNLLYSKSNVLNVNLIKTTFTETFRMFDLISGHCGPAKLTHEINYHSQQFEICHKSGISMVPYIYKFHTVSPY